MKELCFEHQNLIFFNFLWPKLLLSIMKKINKFIFLSFHQPQQKRSFSFTNIKMFSYKEAVEKLNSLQSNAALLEKLRKAGPTMSKKSLPEMRDYFKRIGYQPKDFDKLNLIHVTGTKGKGSTSALTQSVLHNYDSSIKTGLFTSPHLVAVRERIRINGVPISEELFAKYSQDVWERLEATKEEAIKAMNLSEQDTKEMLRNTREHPDKPIYFRYLTLVALHAFVQEKVKLTYNQDRQLHY